MNEKNQLLEKETFLTCTEVARLFRVTPRTISRWIKDGRFQSVVKRGRYKLIANKEVQMLLNESAGGAWNYEVTKDGIKLCIAKNTKGNNF